METIYLIERGRVPFEAIQRLEAGLKDPASGLLVAPVDEEVAQAVHKVSRDVVPDMPEGIIAATALHLRLPLVTRHQRIQSAGIKPIGHKSRFSELPSTEKSRNIRAPVIVCIFDVNETVTMSGVQHIVCVP